MVTTPQQLLADAQARISELLRASPAADLERNMKALLAQTFQKLELVTREEFEIERERLSRLQRRIDALERELDTRAHMPTSAARDAAGASASPIPPPPAAASGRTAPDHPFAPPAAGA